MDSSQLNWIAGYIWGIADDVLRDLYVRGKYRDVILPMTVLRRLDAVLEPTKQAVLAMKENLDKAGVTNQDAALRQASGQAFYNTSTFTLRDLRARASQQQLRADFENYLEGFSSNVQDILENFEFRNQIPRLSNTTPIPNSRWSPAAATARCCSWPTCARRGSTIRRWAATSPRSTTARRCSRVLTNRKPKHRRGKVQLIDATQWF